jgi:putative transposase
MPSRNSIKQFEADSAYHIYNRGVDKRVIFCDQQDYAVFLSFLKHALSEDKGEMFDSSLISDAQRFNFRRLNLAESVDLLAFCLMPNHFHLLIYQHSQDGITKLMRSIATAYSIYFNKRYDRSGTLFQGRYKASRILNDSYWQHISRYIHLNALDVTRDYKSYPYGSFRYYIKAAKAEWVKPKIILDSFSGINEYEEFHDDYKEVRKELIDIKEMLADH